LWLLPLVLLTYNIFRAWFTWWISRLREAEKHSGWSPKEKEYIWYYRARWIMNLVAAVAVIAAAWRIFEWLFLVQVVLAHP
jgi:hypothetical protein